MDTITILDGLFTTVIKKCNNCYEISKIFISLNFMKSFLVFIGFYIN